MDQTYTLPDEIWLIIFGYVPLEDRMKNIQFVSKHFHMLCYDRMITKSLAFNQAPFMSDKIGIKVIRKAKNWMHELSMRGCHWFSARGLFTKIPKLPSLVTLDLTQCFLSGMQLHRLLTKTPCLKNLTFSITSEEIGSLWNGDGPRPKLQLELDKLHIDCVITGEVPVPLGRDNTGAILFPAHYGEKYRKLMRGLCRYVCYSLGGAHRSLSVDFGDVVPLLASFYKPFFCMGPSKYVFDFECPFYLYMPRACEDLCNRLFIMGFHSHVDDPWQFGFEPSCCDLMNVKYLSLPRIISYPPLRPFVREYPCRGSKCPDELPNLESLIVEMDNWTLLFFKCYDNLRLKLALECKLPNLRCLNLGCEIKEVRTQPVPHKFYSRLASLHKLEELNLRNLAIDLKLLLKSLEELKNLKGLSITLNKSILLEDEEIGPSSVIPQRSLIKFFPNLVQIPLHLKKLEVAQSLNFKASISSFFLADIYSFDNLEVLSLSDISFVQPTLFTNMVSKCSNLRSLTLSNIGRAGHCEYSKLLSHTLQSLPYLIELRLRHKYLELSRKLLDEICKCEKLEKLVLQRDTSLKITPSAMLKHFEFVTAHCPRLHMFAIISPDFSHQICDKIQEYYEDLISYGHNAVVFCGMPDQDNPPMPPVLKKLVCFSKSIIGTHNAYDFPYSLTDV